VDRSRMSGLKLKPRLGGVLFFLLLAKSRDNYPWLPSLAAATHAGRA
jgi:hypothetical protein